MTSRLLIVAFSTLVGDARVLKQIERFSESYAVTTVGYGPAPEGVEHHVQVPDEHPLYRWPVAPLLLRQYRRAYWGNPAIAAARAGLDGRTFDLALANDVEAAPLALEVTDPRRVHVDLHEYAPRQRDDQWKWRLAVAPFVRWMLRAHVTRAASTSTVSTGLAREYRSSFGLDPVVVTNATPYREGVPTPTTTPLALVHSGAGLANRGIELMIDAVDASAAEVTLDLYLTHNDPAFIDRLRERCAQSTRCTLRDPVPYGVLVDVLARYDVGVFVLPPVTFNYRWALPNKLFDFIQARLAIIVGPSPEMSWIVNERGLGVVTGDFTADALRRAIEGLTALDVDQYKRASNSAARPLSSDAQVDLWQNALSALEGRAGRG